MSELIVDATAVGSLRLGIRIAIVWLSGFVEADVRLSLRRNVILNILARRLPRVADDGLDWGWS
jgi:hypothetical protein